MIFFISCSGDKKRNNAGNSETIVLNIDKLIEEDKTPVNFSDLFSGFQIIPLETVKESQFSRIGNIKVLEDTICILDQSSNSIFIFSRQGKFINKIRKPGRGPSEYDHIFDFDVEITDGSLKIFVLTNLFGIHVYNSGGNFLKNIRLPDKFSSLLLSGGYIYLYRSYPSRLSDDEYLIYRVNKDGKVLNKFIKYSETQQGPRVYEIIMGGNFFNSSEDVKFYMPYSETIFSITSNSIKPFITLKTEKYLLTDHDIEEVKRSWDRIRETPPLTPVRLEKFERIEGYSEVGNSIFFRFNIAFKRYNVFYYPLSKEVICWSKHIDDLTFVNPNLFNINNGKLVAYKYPTVLNTMKENIKNGKIKVREDEREKILSISEFSNPFIILYDIRRK